MTDTPRRPTFARIEVQPVEMFESPAALDSESPPVDSAAAPESAAPQVMCQWCMAPAPAGSPQCPACGGSIAERPTESGILPGANDFELMAHFMTGGGESENARLCLVENYLHQRAGGMPLSDRRDAHRDYFEEALKQGADGRSSMTPGVELPPHMCRWCNTPGSDTDELCSKCGTRFPTPPPALVAAYEQPEPERIACQWCQSRIEHAMSTCPSCGGSLGGDDQQVFGLTDLTPVERAAEYAYQQAPPLHHPLLGPDPRAREAAKSAREFLRRKR